MFIQKSYKENSYLVFNHPVSGKRTKITTKKLEKILFEYFTTRPEESNLNLERFKKEVVSYAKTNFSKNNASLYLHSMEKLIQVFGNLSIDQITAKHFETYKEKRLEEVKPTSVNIELRCLKAIFNLGVKWEYLGKNPAKDVKQFSIPQTEPSVLTSSDISRINSFLPPQIQDIVSFAFLTGCRISEILNLQIQDIDLKNLILVIRNTKTFKTKSGKIRRIPISGKLEELLRRIIFPENNILSLPESYLFSNRNGQIYDRNFISRHFKKALRAGGYDEKFHFHSLRHSFVTNLVKSGVNLNYIKLLAGHADIKTTEGYIHLHLEDLREAVNRL